MKLQGFSNYEIYLEEGKVWSYKRNKFIGNKNPDGYWYVTLYDNGGEKHTFRRCRLIWEAANGEIPENMQINHKNEVVWDDRLENIEICTPSYNSNYGTRNQRIAEKQSKQVGAYQDGVLVLVFPSTRETGRQGYNISAVSQCCNGKRNHHKGYIWKYLN